MDIILAVILIGLVVVVVFGYNRIMDRIEVWGERRNRRKKHSYTRGT